MSGLKTGAIAGAASASATALAEGRNPFTNRGFTERTILQDNRERGKVGEEITRSKIEAEGSDILGEKVKVKTSGNKGPIADFIIRDKNGNIIIYETKTGNAGLTEVQAAGYPRIMNNGGNLSPRWNGILPNPLPPTPVKIIRIIR